MLVFGQFLFCFSHLLLLWWVLTILPKSETSKHKTKMRVVCVGSVFVFRANLTCRPFPSVQFRSVDRWLPEVAFGNVKRNRNDLGFILRSELSAPKWSTLTWEGIPGTAAKGKKEIRIFESPYWNGNKADGIAMINFWENIQRYRSSSSLWEPLRQPAYCIHTCSSPEYNKYDYAFRNEFFLTRRNNQTTNVILDNFRYPQRSTTSVCCLTGWMVQKSISWRFLFSISL